MSESKPDPIVINMTSINPEPITMGGIDLKHDWLTLINSAPFQMFCYETRAQGEQGINNIEEWIKQTIEPEVLSDENKLFAEFEAWHTAKGYWPNETVYGELK
ncbi:hypothetical protein I9054_007100 [Acinetobacter bereziniae]|uniref:Uncharacterized protein n=1 Tax=Acinetobacter bereziniae TaxID=106648 RepID=A0A8I1AI47_ACIBZ|nr:hypothetical protein [Acinetobacter bereziniae]UUN99211.1 hypothetical protein I9054_007100 [Acinetobacter bereziniae]